MKEFHVFTDKQNTHEQGFIFEVSRDDEDPTQVRIQELWVVVEQKDSTIRTRVHLEQMVQAIIHQYGGNVPDNNMQTVLDIFTDLLPEDKKLELQVEFCQREIEHSTLTESEKLIKASEYGSLLYEELGNNYKFVEDIINKRQQ